MSKRKQVRRILKQIRKRTILPMMFDVSDMELMAAELYGGGIRKRRKAGGR